MSEALLGQYDTLQWTEEEFQAVIARSVDLDNHPELRADLARFSDERSAWIQSTHHVVDRIVWEKFCRKMGERDIERRWQEEVILPNHIPLDKPNVEEIELIWFERNAPDLLPELEAHRLWQRLRNTEWENIWELKRHDSIQDYKKGIKGTKRSSNNKTTG